MSELIQLTVCARSNRDMSFVIRSYGLTQYSWLGSYGLVQYSVVFVVGVVGGCIVTFIIVFVIALVLINKIKAR